MPDLSKDGLRGLFMRRTQSENNLSSLNDINRSRTFSEPPPSFNRERFSQNMLTNSFQIGETSGTPTKTVDHTNPRRHSTPKLQRQSKSDEIIIQIRQDRPSPSSTSNISSNPKHEQRVRSNASRFLGEQSDAQGKTQRTKGRTRVAAVPKLAWRTAKRLLDDRVELRSLHSPDRTSVSIKSGSESSTSSPITPVHTHPSDPKATDPIPFRPKRQYEDAEGAGVAASRTPRLSSPTSISLPSLLVKEGARPLPTPPTSTSGAPPALPSRIQSPSRRSPPDGLASGVESSRVDRSKSITKNGPSTCSYEGCTKTSLGAPYKPWMRWRCCGCRHETHWESDVCSVMDCVHPRCKTCENIIV